MAKPEDSDEQSSSYQTCGELHLHDFRKCSCSSFFWFCGEELFALLQFTRFPQPFVLVPLSIAPLQKFMYAPKAAESHLGSEPKRNRSGRRRRTRFGSDHHWAQCSAATWRGQDSNGSHVPCFTTGAIFLPPQQKGSLDVFGMWRPSLVGWKLGRLFPKFSRHASQ